MGVHCRAKAFLIGKPSHQISGRGDWMLLVGLLLLLCHLLSDYSPLGSQTEKKSPFFNVFFPLRRKFCYLQRWPISFMKLQLLHPPCPIRIQTCPLACPNVSICIRVEKTLNILDPSQPCPSVSVLGICPRWICVWGSVRFS